MTGALALGLSIWAGVPLDTMFFLLITTLFAGFLAFYNISTILHRPPALRMDEQGITGFYSAPVHWPEVKSIAVTQRRNGQQQQLFFALHDPGAFRDRQTVRQRFMSWFGAATRGYSIAVPDSIVKDADITGLAEIAEQLRIKHASHVDVT